MSPKKVFWIFQIIILLFLNFRFETFGQLNGTYTINPNGNNFSGNPTGVSGKNYTSIKNAINALRNYGISGQVIFNIESGSYNEQIEIPYITGVSPYKKIIFQAANHDSNSVEIYYSAYKNDSNWVIQLNGASFIVLKHLKINALGNYYSTAVSLINDANYNIISNCCIVSNYSNYYNSAGINIINNIAFFRNQIIKNHIIGGYYGIRLYGWGLGNIIKDNIVEQFLTSGIYASQQDSMIISGNTIWSDKDYNGIHGIYTQSCANTIQIFNNKIYLSTSKGGYGIRQNSCNEGIIYNNFISINATQTCTIYGIDLSGSTYQKLYYNSVNVMKSIGNNIMSYVVSLTGSNVPGKGVDMKNNIFANMAGGYIITYNNLNQILSSDYNNLFTNYGSGTSGSNQIDLLSWINKTGQDSHSVAVCPYYFSKDNLHISTISLNNKGIALSDVTTDIDGDIRGNYPDIGADEFEPLNNDIAIIELLSPKSFCSGTTPVSIVLRNCGIDTIKAVNINWEVNGNRQTTLHLSSVSIPSHVDLSIIIGYYPLNADSTYSIKIWTSQPNGKNDENTKNDTITGIKLLPGLKGEYIIGKSGSHFRTINAAIQALNTYGVCGPVTFRIKPDIYEEQLTFTPIPGASESNRIVFESYDKDSTSVEITYNPQLSAMNYTIALNGADYITLRYLTVACLGNVQSYAINLLNDANYNIISNCLIYSGKTGNSDNNFLIYSKSSGSSVTGDFNTFQYNRLVGGYISVYLRSYTIPSKGNKLINNTLLSFNNSAMEISLQSEIFISGNYISSDFFVYRAVSMDRCDENSVFSNNKVLLTLASVSNNAFTFSGCNGNTHFVLICNNYFQIRVLEQPEPNYTFEGIRINNCSYLKFAFNTVIIDSVTIYENSIVMNCYSCSNTYIMNNIFLNFIRGYIYSSNSSTTWTNLVINYNCLYSNSNYIASVITGSTITKKNFSGWQQLSGYDLQSKNLIPRFIRENDVHVCVSGVDGAGYPIQEITKDIDGDLRDTIHPDIGADEFTAYNYDLVILEIKSPVIPCDSNYHDVVIRVRNIGIKTINWIKISWEGDQVSQPSKYFTTNLVTYEDTLLTIGSYFFTKTRQNHLKIWIDSVEYQPDMQKNYDTVTASAHPGMAGIYSIGKQGNKDFRSINEAVAALIQNGICDKVVFNIDPGIYYEQINIPEIRGTSATKTITFQSSTKNRNDVVITYFSSSTTYHILKLISADYIHFENLTISANNNESYCYALDFSGECQYNHFSHLKIELTGMLYHKGIFFENNSECSYNYFTHNEIISSGDGVYCNSSLIANRYKNNTFYANHLKTGRIGFYLNNQPATILKNNLIEPYNSINTAVQITNNSENSEISGNKINLLNIQGSPSGMIISNAYGKKEKKILIANNFIIVKSISDNLQVKGISFDNCNNFDIYHNTIWIEGKNNSSVNVSFSCKKDYQYGFNNLANNILINSGSGTLINVSANAVSSKNLAYSDYNCLINIFNNLGKYGNTDCVSLSDWQNYSKKDSHSFSRLPEFFSEEDLHLKNYDDLRINNPLKEVTVDIDSQLRSILKPVVGADESPVYLFDIEAFSSLNNKDEICEGPHQLKIGIRNKGILSLDTFYLSATLNQKALCYDTFYFKLNHLCDTILLSVTDTFLANNQNLLEISVWLPEWIKEGDTLNNHLSIKYNQIIKIPEITSVINDTVCLLGTATLKVRGNAFNYLWYNAPASKSPIIADSVLKHFACTSNITYYAEGINMVKNYDSLSVSRSTQLMNSTPLFTMGFMFSLKAINKDILIDSIGVISDQPSGTPVPLAIYYKSGSYKGFQNNPKYWKLLKYDTIFSGGKNNFTFVSLNNFYLKNNEEYSFYLSSTDPYVLLKAINCVNDINGKDLTISKASLIYYPFENDFIQDKLAIIQVKYAKIGYCYSPRKAVSIYVKPIPHVDLGRDRIICFDDFPVLDAGEGPEFKYVWKYGNNPNIISTAQKLVIDTSGTYSVFVSDGCGYSSYDEVTLIVNPKPDAKIEVKDTRQCLTDNHFYFDANVAIYRGNVVSFYWSFGDDDHSLIKNPEHRYSEEGKYTVKLITFSAEGCSDTAIFDSILVFPSPKADFVVNQAVQCASDNNFIFKNKSNISSGQLDYFWLLGDGKTSNDQNPQHHYQNAGLFHVWLIATSENQCKDSVEKIVEVLQNPEVNLGNDTTVKINQSVILKPKQQYDSYLWSDFSTADSLVVSSAYVTKKTIWLKVMKNGCSGSDTINIQFDSTVNILPVMGMNLSIFPNPAQNYLFLTVNPCPQVDIHYEITDLSGHIVQKGEVNKTVNYIDIHNLPDGLYILRGFTDKNTFEVKLTKQ